MKKHIGILTALAVSLGLLTACGDNKAKDKLLGGVDYGTNGVDPGSGIGGGTGGGVTLNTSSSALKEGAAAAALEAASTVGDGAYSIGSNFNAPASFAAPLPAPAPFTDAGDGYWYLSGPEADGDYVKAKFLCAFGTMLDPNDPFSIINVATIEVDYYDPDSEGGYVRATFTFNVGGFQSHVDMTMNGRIDLVGPPGQASFTATDIMVDGIDGTLKGGLLTGTGTFLDGSTMRLSLMFYNNTLTGTATLGSETISIHVDDQGNNYYTDATGMHPISG